MSKFFRVDGGDYKITVQNGGTITLDTGSEEGTVIVTGDLTVLGETTTINTTNTAIEDNVIVLNSGETGSGITDAGNTSGLEIDRGTRTNSFFVYDDSLDDPVNVGDGSSNYDGLFVLKLSGGGFRGLKTNHINTGGADLNLINEGTGTITVAGTNNYEAQVTDDDDITNKKYVDDAISTAFATVFLKQIGDGVTSPSRIVVADSEAAPDGSGVPQSNITFTIDGTVISTVYEDRWEFQDIRITDTTIETMTTDQDDLIIRAWGDGSVRIEDVLAITKKASAFTPSDPDDGFKLYSDDEYTGNTGIFFVNENRTRDELVSKNRALLFGMLF